MGNDDAVRNLLVHLYRCQTADEKNARLSKYSNKMGFSRAHSKEGSRIAERILAGELLEQTDLNLGRRIALHYVNQAVLTKTFNVK